MNDQNTPLGKCVPTSASADWRSGMPERVVSILRVSTKKQLNDGDGIENQRRGNTEYIRRKGYHLVREFVVAESAEGDERADFEDAVRQAMSRDLGIKVIVFWKVDRISRGGVLPYYTLKGVLAKHNIRIEFATEQIDGSPTGELMETLLAGMARFENRLRVERTIGVARILTKDGYWCRGAPTGFQVGRLDGKPILVPRDPDQWAILRFGLLKLLDGAETAAAVGRELRSKGLRSNKGTPLLRSTWHTICHSPVYGGLICEPWTGGQFVRAKFDGPITPEQWHRLQRVLHGDVPRIAAPPPRKAAHPDFPLRRFLGCPACERTARGYFARGQLGGRFGYYDCASAACRFRIPSARVHTEFVALLNRLTPTPTLLDLFRDATLHAWHAALAAKQAAARPLATQHNDLLAEKTQVLTLMKRAATNPPLLATLEADYDRIERDLSALATGGVDCAWERHDPETIVNACIATLGRTVELWQSWQLDQQLRLQRLVFPEGLTYDELTGCRTPRVSLLYQLLADEQTLKSELADQNGRTTNLVLFTLLEWYRALELLEADL